LTARSTSLLVLAAVLAVVLAVAVAIAPSATLIAVLAIGIVVLAWHSPPLALGAAVLLFAFEGSVKILLGLDDVALPGGSRAAGAAALDIALAAAIGGVLFQDRLRAPRALWSGATRAERVVIGSLGAWLALSVLQIAEGGDLSRGVHAFRLFQWYTLLAVAALTVFAQPRLRPLALRALLGICFAVSLYAAVRVVIGPADAERGFALAVPTVTSYGGTFRAVGSFSSAVGLSSFLTPAAALAFVFGLLRPEVRVFAWTVGGLALIGLIGSFSRASLFGVALGLASGLLLVLVASRMSARRRLVSAGLVVLVMACAYTGLWAASQASPELRERATGVLNPFADESVQLRFEGWKQTVEEAADRPFGHGLGTVGDASGPDVARIRTTDNSFLKVLVDQGVLGFTLFVGGILGAMVVLARRLRGAADLESQAVGLAALAGFVAFLGVCLAGESVEQPGKVIAWVLLGVAAAHAFPGPSEAGAGAT
jgi:O-antigen ligase